MAVASKTLEYRAHFISCAHLIYIAEHCSQVYCVNIFKTVKTMKSNSGSLQLIDIMRASMTNAKLICCELEDIEVNDLHILLVAYWYIQTSHFILSYSFRGSGFPSMSQKRNLLYTRGSRPGGPKMSLYYMGGHTSEWPPCNSYISPAAVYLAGHSFPKQNQQFSRDALSGTWNNQRIALVALL